jgi:prevent-host-death family protein
MDPTRSKEVGLRQAREGFAEVVNEVVVRGTITYLTNRGRRIAAIVPLEVAERAERERDSE